MLRKAKEESNSMLTTVLNFVGLPVRYSADPWLAPPGHASLNYGT